MSFLHGPHQLYDNYSFIRYLLCVAIKDNGHICLHDDRDPLVDTCQFNHIGMSRGLGKLWLLLLLSSITNRVTICISKDPLLLYDLWFRLLSCFSLLLGWCGPSEDGAICTTLVVVLSELSVLGHVCGSLNSSALGIVIRGAKCLKQEVLHHHLLFEAVKY